MNLSSRWSVTAVVALGALGCSDPVPPPAQGAFWANVKSVSPQPAGKSCPSGASLTFDVPQANENASPPEVLDADNYKLRKIDGEDQAEVSCSVKGGGTFTFEGSIKFGARALSISSGTIGDNKKGTARISLRASGSPGFSGSLSAPSPNCVIDAAAAPGNRFEVAPGRIWAHFQCPSVEQPPSDFCQAEGYFVLENCDQ
jgi:hypothetical protein